MLLLMMWDAIALPARQRPQRERIEGTHPKDESTTEGCSEAVKPLGMIMVVVLIRSAISKFVPLQQPIANGPM